MYQAHGELRELGAFKMATETLISFDELKKLSGVKHFRLQHWCRQKLLDIQYERSNKRLFEKEENLLRVRFIQARQRGTRPVRLEEILKLIQSGEHRKK